MAILFCFFFYYFNLYLFNLQSIHPSITHLGGILILKESEKTQNPSTQAFAKHCDPAEKVLEVGHGETLSTNVSTLEARLGKPIRSACLCEKTPLCLSSGGSNVRNDALEASLDTVKLQRDCVMPPRGCSTSWKPRGDHPSSVNFF